MRKVILASASPRRKELLAKMGVTFTVVPSRFEEYLDDARSPEAVAKELGLGKALAVAQKHPDAIVIGSDAIVSLGNHQLAKPESPDEAHAMLKLLSSAPHKVSTSVAVVCMSEHIQLVEVAEAWVYLKPYNEATAEAYIRTGDYIDKAGGYAVQNPAAAPLIDHLKGDFETVVGLPTHVLAAMLRQFDIAAHPADLPQPKGLIVKRLLSAHQSD
jgi:nucleoside triphosphate pyrophosphatase